MTTYNPPPWATKEEVPSQRWKGSSIIDPHMTDEERLRHLNEVYYYNGARADAEAKARKKARQKEETGFNGEGQTVLCAAERCVVRIPKKQWREGNRLCPRCEERIRASGKEGYIQYVEAH